MTQRLLANTAAWLAASLALAGCGSTPPVHLHTLLSPDVTATRAAGGPTVLLESVTVPASVDQPQWLVRMPDGTLAQLENERWASALSDELRAALADALVRAGLVDARSPGAPPAQWRARVEVTRFDTASGGETRIAGVWAVGPATRAPGNAQLPSIRCAFDVREDAGTGTPALAQAHRRAVASVGAALAAATQALARGATASCP